MFRLLMILCGLLFGVQDQAQAQANRGAFPETPELVVSIGPDGVLERGAYVNEQIVLHVRVVSRAPFETLSLQVPEAEGADQIRLLAPRTRSVNSYAGSGFVHETAIALFAQTTGALTIPAITLSGSVSRNGNVVSFELAHPAQSIQIRGIPQAFKDPWWLVSENVKVSETWSTEPDDIRYGETVRRELTIVVAGATGAQIPVLEHGLTRGTTVLEDGRTSTTKVTPSGIIGEVTQAWTLKVEGLGVVYLPPLGVAYWDPAEQKRRKAFVKGRRIEPLPVAVEEIAARLMEEANASHRADQRIAMLLLALAVLPLVIMALVALWTALPTRADLRLIFRRDPQEASATDHLRAIETWASDSGITFRHDEKGMPILPTSLRGLRDSVYGRTAQAGDTKGVFWDLLHYARRHRFQKLLMRVSRGA